MGEWSVAGHERRGGIKEATGGGPGVVHRGRWSREGCGDSCGASASVPCALPLLPLQVGLEEPAALLQLRQLLPAVCMACPQRLESRNNLKVHNSSAQAPCPVSRGASRGESGCEKEGGMQTVRVFLASVTASRVVLMDLGRPSSISSCTSNRVNRPRQFSQIRRATNKNRPARGHRQ